MNEDAALQRNPSMTSHLALLKFNMLIRKQPSVKLDLFPIHATVIPMCIPRVTSIPLEAVNMHWSLMMM